MASDIDKKDPSANRSDSTVKRRGLLRIGALLTAFTGASAISPIGASSAQAEPIDATALEAYVPIAEKGAPSGVAALDLEAKVPLSQLPDLSALIATTPPGSNAINNAAAIGSLAALRWGQF
jgi:hypothetical protein